MAYEFDSRWTPYIPAATRRAQTAKKIAALKKKGRVVTPVLVEGRAIARTFWGKAWCDNLESYSDFSNRLPRGRTYVRNGSVVDLQIAAGNVTAIVSGSELYDVTVTVQPIARTRWRAVASACAGQIDSLVELLAGKLSRGVMQHLVEKERGLFPKPKELSFTCSCPDYASMCKHVAAVLYGVGHRLDDAPQLLFTLRKVDAAELVAQAARGLPRTRKTSSAKKLDAAALSDIFGIELEVASATKQQSRRRGR